jgi:hypothetical protein
MYLFKYDQYINLFICLYTLDDKKEKKSDGITYLSVGVVPD